MGIIRTWNKNDFFNFHLGFFRESLFCTFRCINHWFGGPWDMFSVWKCWSLFDPLRPSVLYQKSHNLQYNMPDCWDDHLIDQESSWCSKNIFFHDFMQNYCKNSFNSFFITLQKIKRFSCPKSKPATHFKSIKIILGPSDTCLLRQTRQRASVLCWILSC